MGAAALRPDIASRRAHPPVRAQRRCAPTSPRAAHTPLYGRSGAAPRHRLAPRTPPCTGAAALRPDSPLP
jgi:hypothetical protein